MYGERLSFVPVCCHISLGRRIALLVGNALLSFQVGWILLADIRPLGIGEVERTAAA